MSNAGGTPPDDMGRLTQPPLRMFGDGGEGGVSQDGEIVKLNVSTAQRSKNTDKADQVGLRTRLRVIRHPPHSSAAPHPPGSKAPWWG